MSTHSNEGRARRTTSEGSPRRARRAASLWVAAATLTAVAACASAGGASSGASQDLAPASSPPAPGDPYAEFAPLPPAPAAVEPFPEDPELAALPSTGKAGVIHRRALERFVSQGPGYALQLVRVQPTFEAGRFTGFKITGLTEEGSRLVGDVLEPGDVVVRINRHEIARPEEYMAAWESLKECGEVSVQIVRGGQPMELIWPIEG